jgi:glycosyltransferase involved in cell wall biosynthesis
MRTSCIIPVYNGERYLSAALDSVLAQNPRPLEIVVVDDGSADGTAAILQAYASSIRVVRQRNLGVAAARNAGLREIKGDVVAFLDADDIWPTGRMKVLADELEGDAAADVAAGMVDILDQRPVKPAAKENLSTMHRVHCMGSLLVRRSAFDRIGWFNESLTVAEDTEFIMRARDRGIVFKLMDVVSVIYRLHENNISRDINRNQSSALDAIRSVMRTRRAT